MSLFWQIFLAIVLAPFAIAIVAGVLTVVFAILDLLFSTLFDGLDDLAKLIKKKLKK